MKNNLFYFGLVTCLLTGGVVRADTEFIYNIHLPNITNGGAEDDSAFTQYPFSWTGPLKFNAPAGSDCPTLCGPPLGTTVNSNYFFDGFSFTSVGSDAEVLVKFAQFLPSIDLSKQIIFSFVESDAFWSTTGTGLSFPSVSGTPSFTFLGGSATACTGCTVDISTVTTPEPRSAILLGLLVAAAGVLVERRRRQATATS